MKLYYISIITIYSYYSYIAWPLFSHMPVHCGSVIVCRLPFIITVSIGFRMMLVTRARKQASELSLCQSSIAS